jgi:GNAT superfamily N-acetyltransferase
MFAIKQATPTDAPAIQQLAEQTWWPAYSPILQPEQISYMLAELYSIETLTNQIAQNLQTFLLVMEGEQPVAFAAYSPRHDNPDVYKLHKLYCHPDTQGKGYGKLLINTVIQKTLEAGKHVLELNVNRHNKAKTLYEKMGFAVAYTEDIPIGPYWMNDYVMRKEL